MPACPPDVDARVYEDALLDLSRAARAFAAAIVRAAETSERVDDDTSAALAAHVIDECRAALVPALVRAPGMLQLFVMPS